MSSVRRVVRAIGLPALGGLAVWLVVAAVAANVDTAALDLVSVLLLFAQLVIVPVGMLLIPASGASPLARALVRGGRFGFRIGGVAALASLALPRGELAAAVAALYLVPGLLVAGASLLRAPSVRSASELAEVAAGPLLAAGAVLFVLHRQDVAFTGFPELAVQVASVHLHVVGFGLVLMAGALARRSVRLGGAAVGLLVVGALTSPFLPAAGSVLVLAGLATLVAGTFAVLGRPDLPAGARRLLFVSIAFALFAGGVAAASAIGLGNLDVGSMARLHGTFAAIGVVFIGLVGWRLAEGA
jgi:hypothetical protein